MTFTATLDDQFQNGKGTAGVFLADFAADPAQTSAYQGNYVLDVTGPGGQPNLSFFAYQHPRVSGTLTGTGAARLDVEASFFPGQLNSDDLVNLGVFADARVEYDTDLSFRPDGAVDVNGGGVVVALDNVRLDLGKLYNDFVDPLLYTLQDELLPLQPVVDVLLAPLPVISDLQTALGEEPSDAFDLARIGKFGEDLDAIDQAEQAVRAINFILEYEGLAPGAAGEGEDEPLFGFTVTKAMFDPDAEEAATEDFRLELADKHWDPESNAQVESEWGWDASIEGGVDLPFLRDFNILAGYLRGDSSGEFFTFDVAADFELTFDVSVPIPALLNLVQLNAGFNFHAHLDLAGGYDALGVQRLTQAADFSSDEATLDASVRANQDFLWHGFYLDDHNPGGPDNRDNDADDAPEVVLGVSVTGGPSAGVDLTAVQFTVGGDIIYTADLLFDLNDLPDPDPDYTPDQWADPLTPIWDTADPTAWTYDGRVRIPEWKTIADKDPGALFNLDGELTVGLNASIEVETLGITVGSQEWELYEVTLVDGNIAQPSDLEIIGALNSPQLGTVDENGRLTVFVGDEAVHRNRAPGVTDENVVIKSLGHSQGVGERVAVVFVEQIDATTRKNHVQYFENVTSIEVHGGTGADVIRIMPGVVGDVDVSGDAGNDELLYLGDGTARLDGGDGDDTLRGGGNRDTLFGGAGDDVLDGASGDDVLDGGADDDTLFGGAGDDTLTGQAGDDYLDGGTGDDQLLGADGDDVLRGNVGSDTVHGDAGADRIQFAFFLDDPEGMDAVFGGTNSDILEVIGTEQADHLVVEQIAPGGFRVTNDGRTNFQFSLPTDVTQRDVEELQVSGLGGDDRIEAIGVFNVNRLRIAGGDGDDVLVGSGGSDLILGGAGNDVIDGGAGRDELHGDAGDDSLDGGDGNDALYGGADADVLDGGAGTDVSHGGDGDDRLEAGSDTVHGDILYGDAGDDSLLGGDAIDILFGGAGNDRLEGFGLVDVLQGEAGQDTLIGGAGRDYLFGGADADRLFAMTETETGEPTNPAFDWTDAYQKLRDREDELFAELQQPGLSPDREAELQNELALVNLAENDLLDHQTVQVDVLDGGDGDDWLRGSDYPDTLLGGAGNDTIVHTSGDDVIFGGAGTDDTFLVEGTQTDDVVGIELHDNGGSPYVLVTIDGVAAARVDHLEIESVAVDALAGNDTVTVSFGSNAAMRVKVDGGEGDDLLDASTLQESATLDGGAGNDTIIGGLAGDILAGGAGTDLLRAEGDVDFTLSNTLLTGHGSDTVSGFERAELTGGAGNNELDAGAFSGSVTLVGGAGDDTLHSAAGSDRLDGGDGTDKVVAEKNADLVLNDTRLTGKGTDTLVDVEQAELIGGTGDNSLDASAFTGPVTLRGGSGNDSLEGGSGNDFLYGDDHNDTLRGNDGNDVLYGGDVWDYLYGGDGNDTIHGDGGNDRIYGNDGLTWNTSDHDGDDWLYGDAGDDHIEGENGNDRLYGGSGNDDLRGLAGNDSLYGEAGNDYMLGQDGNDYLHGSDGNDYINGGNGNDSLHGGNGADNLVGEASNDYLHGGKDGTRDTLNGGSGNDSGVMYRRWVPVLFSGYWVYQETHSGVDNITYNPGW